MRKPGCLRAFVCAVCVPALVVCASFVPVACFSTVPLLRSHLAAPTRYCVGASCVRAGGGRAGLLWACLLVGGGVSCSRGCLLGWRVRFGVGALAWVAGAVWSRRSCPRLIGWCSHAGVGGFGVCAGRNGKWGGTTMSRPMLRGAVPHAVCAWGEGREGWGCSRGGEHNPPACARLRVNG